MSRDKASPDSISNMGRTDDCRYHMIYNVTNFCRQVAKFMFFVWSLDINARQRASVPVTREFSTLDPFGY
jgi:hypothetical protein